MAIGDYTRALQMGQNAQPDPLQMAFGGVNQGLQMGAQMAQQRDQMANDQRRTAVLEQEQRAAAAAAAQYEADAAAFVGNVTPATTRAFLVKYPERGAKIAASLQNLSDEERTAKAKQGFAVGRAIDSGDMRTAASILDQRIIEAEAREDKAAAAAAEKAREMLLSGDKNAIQNYRAELSAATMIAAGPETVEKWTDAAIGARDAESDKRTARMKAIAEADSAASGAKSADIKARTDEDRIKTDILSKRQMIGIRRMEAEAAQIAARAQNATNAIERQRLEIQLADSRQKLVEKKEQYYESNIAGVTEATGSLGLANELLGNKEGLGANSSWSGYLWNRPGSNATLVEAKLERFGEGIGLGAREKLKGQGTITDGEAKALAKSESIILNSKLAVEDKIDEIERVRNIMSGAVNRKRRKLGLRPLKRGELHSLSSNADVLGLPGVEARRDAELNSIRGGGSVAVPASGGANRFSDENY